MSEVPLVVRGSPTRRHNQANVEAAESGDVEIIQIYFDEQDILMRETSRLDSQTSVQFSKCGVKILVLLALLTALMVKISEVAVSRRMSMMPGTLLRVKKHDPGTYYGNMRDDHYLGFPNQQYQLQQPYSASLYQHGSNPNQQGYGMMEYVRAYPSGEGPNTADYIQNTAGFRGYQQLYQNENQHEDSSPSDGGVVHGQVLQNQEYKGQLPDLSQDDSLHDVNGTSSNSSRFIAPILKQERPPGSLLGGLLDSTLVEKGATGPLLLDPNARLAFTRTTGLATPAMRLQQLDNFKDNWEIFDNADEPVFWHIPKSGGSSVKDIIGSCHNLVLASEYGITDGHANDTEIAVVYPKSGENGTYRSPFVNVDTTTVEGIQRAKAMGFADAPLAGSVVTPFIYEANDLFTSYSKGRLFSVFRHPIERAISMFYYLQVATWEPTYNPEMQNWTIEQYAQSGIAESNWMTRLLSHHPLEGDITDDRFVTIAMEVVRHKFLVGLMSDMERTMERFEKFFRWKFRVNPTNQEVCREGLLSKGSNSNAGSTKKEKPKPGSPAWNILANINRYDMQLYGYIETLFEEQEAFVTGQPDNYRLVGSTCCKCDPASYPPEGFECPKAVAN